MEEVLAAREQEQSADDWAYCVQVKDDIWIYDLQDDSILSI